MTGKPSLKPKPRPKMTKLKTVWVTEKTEPFRSDFQVGQQIGEPGQFGKAYRCKRKKDRKILAVKAISKARFYRLDRSQSRRQALMVAMQGEIDIMSRLKHQYIVNMEAVYEDKHTLYIVMEECKGGELFDRIRAKQRYKEIEAAPIIKMMLEALFYMHSYHRVVHCDLKPDNVLFVNKSEDSPIKIIDFGMSKVLPRLRSLQELCGTPYYTAPEIIKGEYAHGCDMWSVGVIMFVMLFGFPPFYVDPQKFYGQKEAKAIYALINKGFKPVIKRGYGPWFPKKMPISKDARILMKHLMETDVAKRFSAKTALQSNFIRNMGHPSINNDSDNNSSSSQNNVMKQMSTSSSTSSLMSTSSTDVSLVYTAHQMANFATNNKFKFAISGLFRGQYEKMRPQHFQNLKKLFAALDTDGNGKIDYKEFKEGMLKSPDMNMTEEQLQRIFAGLDVQAVGEIDFNALLGAAVHDYIIANDQRLYRAFRELDNDEDGKITIGELQAQIQKMNPYGNAAEIEKIVKQMDTDGDGTIDYEEFLHALHPNLNQTPSWFWETKADFQHKSTSSNNNNNNSSSTAAKTTDDDAKDNS